MIRLRVKEGALPSVRLALSPLWETMGSLAVLARYPGVAPSPYTGWARAVREEMPRELSSELLGRVRGHDFPLCPSGGVPLPGSSPGTIGPELDRVRGKQGSAEERRLVLLLERYWEMAIAPHWTAIRSSLEEEVQLRGRTLALHGVEAMLAELGGRVTWARPFLTAPYHRDLDAALGRAGLLLVPTVFGGARRLYLAEGGVTAMSYQARATAYFHVLTGGRREPAVEDKLALLLGRGRADVVRALVVPCTTTALAARLGMAKSTVSQHLTVLSRSGLARKQRRGGQVFYQLDPSGLALLRHLDS